VVPWQYKLFQKNTVISAPILQRERELSLAHAQRCNYLIIKQICGPLSVEIIPGQHCNFSTSLAKRAKAQSGACAEVQFLDYGTVLWSPGSRNGSRKAGKHWDFSTYITKMGESLVWRMRKDAVS
jgi:hypothetical protein